MARFVFRGSILRICLGVLCALAAACVLTRVALAQHPGGHIGGAPHFTPGPRIAPPRFSAPPIPRVTIPPPRFSPNPFLPRFGTLGVRFGRPAYPLQPVFPIFHHPVFFGPRFFRFGLGLGFNSFWWPACGSYWGCPFSCNVLPYYGYSFGNYLSLYSPPAQNVSPLYQSPSYLYGYGYGEDRRDLVHLYLKDGTVYEVTDYWLVDGQLHFTTAAAPGAKSVEHTIAFDDLDLQTTIDVNTQRGFRFVLRNEPLQQYLQHHRDFTPPPAAPPQPDGPQPPPFTPPQTMDER